MAPAPAALYPNVPTLKTAIGSDWQVGAWRGIAVPKGTSPEVVAKLGTELKKIYDSKEYKDFMAQRGFGLLYADSKEFGTYLAKNDAEIGGLMKNLGLAAPQ
jgi:tripartite-type tricarboxylate transporter receptor subunit TctC